MQRTRRAWIAPAAVVALTAIALAGCLGDDDAASDDDEYGPGFPFQGRDAAGHAVPVLFCVAPLDAADDTGRPVTGAAPTRCNFEMTPDDGREGNEVTIAVNPMDPRNVVGGAKDYFPADAGECVWDGVYVTHDGGRSAYEDRSFDGSPWRLLAGDVANFEPNYASTFWCTTDPVAYFDVNGRLYYVLMAYQTDPVTGSKTGEGVLPLGALNDWAFNRATQIVAISDDGGDTFHTFSPVLEGTFPIDFHDKAWLAASADGTIHIMWVAALLPGNMYCRSTDEGTTYLCADILATTVALRPVPDIEAGVVGVGTTGSGQGSFLEVGTGPEVYAIWYGDDGALTDILAEAPPSGIMFRRSLDTGATWEPATLAHATNAQSMPGLESRDRRSGFPALATDRNPDSPFADALYVVWNDRCGDDEWKPADQCLVVGNNSIYFAASYDKGDTWSAGVRISDGDAVDAWSFFPAVSVSPGGVIDVSWMDTRGTRAIACHAGAPSCAQNYGDAYPALTQMYTYSLDGGRTWSRDFEVRDVADDGWDPSLCHHQNGMVFIGDYNDIDSSWQAAHPVWPDSRLGVCDVFTATIQRPMFADGWEPAARAEATLWILQHPL